MSDWRWPPVRVDPARCSGCGTCHNYCTMGAIRFSEAVRPGHRLVSTVDEEDCVDCGVCLRVSGCPHEALIQPVAQWPRSIRGTFSNPLAEHKETRVPGRGTEEMKTNDLTGRYQPGYVGIGVEMGRPNTGAYLRDVEVVTVALARLGVVFEPRNPLTSLIGPGGVISPQVRDEKVLSCIVEFVVERERLAAVLACLAGAADRLGTVFSLDLVELADPSAGDTVAWLRSLGERPYPNGKTNVGLGRLPAPETGGER